ncbi:MAG: fimbrillin family protein [Mediterranea sp.]|nr:fimbrillin family protein [Mediterranea sp.]
MESPEEIRLTTRVDERVVTRGSQDLQATQFANGSKVGIFVDDDGDSTVLVTNNELTADGAGGFSGGMKMYFPENGDAVDIYAYYPYDAAAAGIPTKFTVSEEQGDAAGYMASDFMIGLPDGEGVANPIEHTGTAIPMVFTHQLAKLSVNLTSGDGAPDLLGAKVRILNVVTKAAIDPTTYVATASGEELKNITVGTSTDANTFDCSAVIVPQAYAAGASLIEIELAAGGKLYAATQHTTFAGKSEYIYNVTVNLTGLSVAASITPWVPIGAVDVNAVMPDIP